MVGEAVTWRATDPEGNEADKCRFEVVQYTRGKVLDLGCGPNKGFPHWIGVDNCADTAMFEIPIKPDLKVDDCADMQPYIQDESCDAVFSSHLLEHLADPLAALRSWWQCIKVGGHLVLYLPHADHYPNIGQPHANPDHKHDFRPDDIRAMMARLTGWELLVNETRTERNEYSFLQVYRKAESLTQSLTYRRPRPAKTACVVRYGGYGDMLQAANILPELKRQGFHVTVMTTPRGEDILRHDPHVDAFELQDDDQVPNQELAPFWAAHRRRFDRFINLSESVEGTLLAMAGRSNHGWPDAVRRREMGKNYLEWTAELAELPYRGESRFFATTEEEKQARSRIADVRNALAGPLRAPMQAPQRFNIMWCLAGSSVHKMYPHQDTVMQAVLAEMPEAVIFMTGDMLCKILEAGWEEHPRVRCLSGEIEIRETLALAQRMDCVVGPETGVLNAVAFEPMGKVIMLSHSSIENLTKHWVNAEVLTPQGTPCYPCHRLHHGREFCPEHEASGAAMCQWNTSPFDAFAAIGRHYEDWLRLREMRRAA